MVDKSLVDTHSLVTLKPFQCSSISLYLKAEVQIHEIVQRLGAPKC